MDKHKKLYKAKVDVSDIRNQRTNQTIELRQNRRDEIIQQKRMMPNQDDESFRADSINTLAQTKFILENKNEEDLIKEALSDNYDTRFLALKTIRTILSNRDYRPVDALLKLNVLPALYQCIAREEEPDVQYEALWSLTNIASGESHQTLAVVENNFLPLLLKTFQSPHVKVAEQTAWTLANIVGEGPELRDKVIELNYLKLIYEIVLKATNSPDKINFVPLLQNIAWLMINIVRSKDEPIAPSYTLQSLAIIRELLVGFAGDAKVISDALWSLSFLIDSCPANADIVVESDILRVAVNFFTHGDSRLVLGIIRCLGNLAAGPDTHTDYVCRLNVISQLGLLLDLEEVRIIQETLWVISNIAAGTHDQMRLIIVPSIIDRVLRHLQYGLFMHQKEALWVVSNIVHNGKTDDNMSLVNMGVFDALLSILKSKDSNMIKHALESYIGIFRVCSDYRRELQQRFDIAGAMDTIDSLSMHPKNEVAKLANELSVKYLLVNENDPGAYLDGENIDLDILEDKPYFF